MCAIENNQPALLIDLNFGSDLQLLRLSYERRVLRVFVSTTRMTDPPTNHHEYF